MKREYSDNDEDEEEIDYGDILGGGGGGTSSSSFPETTPLVSMGLPDGVDLNLTRGKTKMLAHFGLQILTVYIGTFLFRRRASRVFECPRTPR